MAGVCYVQGAVLELCDGEGALCLAKIATSGLRQAVSIEATEMPRLVGNFMSLPQAKLI